MIGTFTVIEKPETITWDDLAKCQQQAHINNIASGIQMKCASYSAEELKEKASKGTTFVALDNTGKLSGMLTIIIGSIKRWWHKGIAAEICYVAVAPEFQGYGVYKLLGCYAVEFLKEKGVNVAYLTTHIDNKHAQRAYQKDGYRRVMLTPGSGLDYYSVIMAKWLNGKGKNALLCKLMYWASALAVHLFYKPGKQRRF